MENADAKFMEYKPFLKGMLTSQLLCRLSLQWKEAALDGSQPTIDFWRILGIEDEFDKSYIIAQVERFCILYNVRGNPLDDDGIFGANDYGVSTDNGLTVSPGGSLVPLPPFMDPTAAAAAAAAAAAVSADMKYGSKKSSVGDMGDAHRLVKDTEKAMEVERRQNHKREQRRMAQERKDLKMRERELVAVGKAEERAVREASREERRRKKVEIREQREHYAKEQKEAALKRAEELVKSNRVPIEITRGAAAAKAAANAALVAGGASVSSEEDHTDLGSKKPRSAIVVSTAGDLHTVSKGSGCDVPLLGPMDLIRVVGIAQICTHAKNLWAKYNAIAKEHNQKVNWITVAKELGIHVKVREKYSRMVRLLDHVCVCVFFSIFIDLTSRLWCSMLELVAGVLTG